MKKVTLFLQKHLFVLASMTISIPATTRNKTPIIEITTHEFHSLGSRREEDMPKSVFPKSFVSARRRKSRFYTWRWPKKHLRVTEAGFFPAFWGKVWEFS